MEVHELVKVTESHTGYLSAILPHHQLIKGDSELASKRKFYDKLADRVHKEHDAGANIDLRLITNTEQDYIVRLHRRLSHSWIGSFNPQDESPDDIVASVQQMLNQNSLVS